MFFLPPNQQCQSTVTVQYTKLPPKVTVIPNPSTVQVSKNGKCILFIFHCWKVYFIPLPLMEVYFVKIPFVKWRLALFLHETKDLFSLTHVYQQEQPTYRIFKSRVFIAHEWLCLICFTQLCIKVLIIVTGFTQFHIKAVMLFSHIIKTVCRSDFFCHQMSLKICRCNTIKSQFHMYFTHLWLLSSSYYYYF